jgi:uncharacterized membrane protein YfcA
MLDSDIFTPFLHGHNPTSLGLLMGCALLAGLARGFSGFGAALIFVPLASAIVGPKVAATVLLLVDSVLTLGMIPPAWRIADRREVFTMAIGAAIGIPLGTALLTAGDPLTLRWIISIVAILLLVFLMSGWRYQGRPRTGLTIATGGIAGLFSGAAQLGGPPVVAYWLGGASQANIVRANIILYFAVSTFISTLSYLGNGLFTKDVLVFSLITIPTYGVGLYVGSRLHGLADDRTFRRICFSLIAISAIISLPLFDILTK